MSGEPKDILLDFEIFAGGKDIPCTVSLLGTIQKCLKNKTKQCLWQVLDRWRETFLVLFNGVGPSKESKQPSCPKLGFWMLRRLIMWRWILKEWRVMLRLDKHRGDGKVGSNIQEAEQEPRDAGETHAGKLVLGEVGGRRSEARHREERTKTI